ncbi:MAG: hypothetical protein ACJ0KA_07275 [Verrucomicrobiales bacterium]
MHAQSMIMRGYGLFIEKDPYQGWTHGCGSRIDDNAWIWFIYRKGSISGMDAWTWTFNR